MSLQPVRPAQISHVALRVTALGPSVEFYCDLFGLEPRPAVPPGNGVCVCAAPSASTLTGFGVILIQGLPPSTDPIGMDHLSLEVYRAEDVDDVYLAAVARGAQAIEPRLYSGHYQTFIFDPDGYKIEVVSREAPAESRCWGAETRNRQADGAYRRASVRHPEQDQRRARAGRVAGSLGKASV
jgi:catechol 2,3-dioxygenase-like lactoylglutathione lyase family enzyme